MASVKCKAKTNGEVSERGKASIEWYKDDKPMYYCRGYKDSQTESMIPTCLNCKDCIIYAQEDLNEFENAINDSDVI